MDKLITHTDIKQGSEEWHRLRLGKITGSCFYKLLGTAAIREKYLYDRASEIVTGAKSDSEQYTNIHMQRGHEYENIAREEYKIHTFTDIEEVGFIQLGEHIGYSPDGLIDKDGMIEIKVPDSNNYFKHCLEITDKGYIAIPNEHYIQMQFGLYVSGRKWCDYVLYNPKHAMVGKGLFIQRVEFDTGLQKRIKTAIREGIRTIEQYITRYSKVIKTL